MLKPHTPIILIPARMASARLPGKPLADIGGKPMIVHVWERAVRARAGEAAVACDGGEIARAVEAAGGRAVITDPDLPSGSDRVWRALDIVDPEGRHDIIINLQGDMPSLDPALLRRVLEPLADEAVDIATLAAPVTAREADNPAAVKAVVGSQGGKALYFSRSPIPYGAGEYLHHIGIYAYRRAALEKFVSLPPSPLEKREKLEQLRALEAGMTIGVAIVDEAPPGVDTPEQLEMARRMMR